MSSSVVVVTMLLTALSVFLIWAMPSVHAAVVGVSCLFGAVSVPAFGSLDAVNMHLYDVTVRCVCVQWNTPKEDKPPLYSEVSL